MNFRILITKGLIQIFWSELTAPVFEYTADCNLDGVLLNPTLASQIEGTKCKGSHRACDGGDVGMSCSKRLKVFYASY